MLRRRTCLDWFPSQDEEGFRSLGEESGEFVDKNLLNFDEIEQILVRATVNGFNRTSGELAASISGTLCLSDTWEAKFDNDNAAVSDDRTH
jgi:hypothetical protein